MNQNQLTIFSVFHKPYIVPKSNCIKPIQVGRDLTDIDLGFLTDNTGKNISLKNNTFCELTALYWIWQNLEFIDSQYVGLAHYRRYFVLPLLSRHPFRKYLKTNIYYGLPIDVALEKVTSLELETALIKNLQEEKVIIPTAYYTSVEDIGYVSTKNHFIYNHTKEDWVLMEETVLELYPDYKNSFELFKKAKKTFGFNMFIANKKFIQDYCTWLFEIIFTLEKKVKINEYTYQSRIFGFFSERLINLFLLHNKVQIAEFPVVYLE